MKHEIKRSSKIIKLTKYVLIAIAFVIILVVSYFILINHNSQISKKEGANNNSQANDSIIKFKVEMPNLKGISLDHGPYYIKAAEMQKIADTIYFTDPKIKLMVKHEDWLEITSKRGDLATLTKYLQLDEEVKANLNNLYFLESEQVEIQAKETIIKSKLYAKFNAKEFDLESDNGFIINYHDQTAFFYGKINANIRTDANKQTNITSDKFDVFWLKKTGDFIGHVVMLENGTKVEADKMTVMANHSTNKIDKIYLYGKVKIISDEQTATSEYGEYIVSTSILTLKNQVKLVKNGNVITGETLHYNFKLRRADLVGNGENKVNSKATRVRAVINPKAQGFKS